MKKSLLPVGSRSDLFSDGVQGEVRRQLAGNSDSLPGDQMAR